MGDPQGNYEVQTCDRACSYVLRSTVRVLRGSSKRSNNKTSIRNLLQIVEILGDDQNRWVSISELSSILDVNSNSLLRALKFAKPSVISTRFEPPPVKATVVRLNGKVSCLSDMVGSDRVSKARSVFLK
eukprot:gene1268-1180_t